MVYTLRVSQCDGLIRRVFLIRPFIPLAALVVLVGFYDQAPRKLTPEATEKGRQLINSDLAFGRDMESKLKPGSMVFQMPVMVFPEATPINNIDGVPSSKLQRNPNVQIPGHYGIGLTCLRPR